VGKFRKLRKWRMKTGCAGGDEARRQGRRQGGKET
jgi:hypothetical protein